MFCQNLVRNAKHGMNLTRAYIASGYEGRGHVAESGGSRLMSYVEIQMRVDELARPAVRKAQITIESLLGELETTIADAREAKQHSVVVRSLELAAKLVGLLKDRVEVGRPGEFDDCSSPQEVIDRLLEQHGTDPRAMVSGLRAMMDSIETRVAKMAAEAAPPAMSPRPASGPPRTRSGKLQEGL
jgi:hypothetical protein